MPRGVSASAVDDASSATDAAGRRRARAARRRAGVDDDALRAGLERVRRAVAAAVHVEQHVALRRGEAREAGERERRAADVGRALRREEAPHLEVRAVRRGRRRARRRDEADHLVDRERRGVERASSPHSAQAGIGRFCTICGLAREIVGDAVARSSASSRCRASLSHSAPPSPRSAPPNIRDEEVQFFIASIAVRLPLLGVRLPRPRIC